MSEFKEKVHALQKEWCAFLMSRPMRRRKTSGKAVAGKLRRGLRTAEDAFREPLLATLVELGGSAPVGEVLDRIGNKMKGVLNEYDYQPLASNPNSVRWRNTAQWCRNTLVREGLMKSDSPHGIWEISDLGKDRVG